MLTNVCMLVFVFVCVCVHPAPMTCSPHLTCARGTLHNIAHANIGNLSEMTHATHRSAPSRRGRNCNRGPRSSTACCAAAAAAGPGLAAFAAMSTAAASGPPVGATSAGDLHRHTYARVYGQHMHTNTHTHISHSHAERAQAYPTHPHKHTPKNAHTLICPTTQLHL